jgi:hypothetical protein
MFCYPKQAKIPNRKIKEKTRKSESVRMSESARVESRARGDSKLNSTHKKKQILRFYDCILKSNRFIGL